MATNEVKFSVPKKTTGFSVGQIAEPVCPTASILCLLAKREKLSLRELYIIQKIGFVVKILYDNNPATEEILL